MILQKAHIPLEVDTRPLLNHLISGLTQFLGDHVEKGTVSSVGNYIVTGLNSHLLKGAKVRFFEASRSADTLIQPHSHRYCLFSLVIRGRVTHTLYRRTKNQDTAEGEDFAVRKIEFVGEDHRAPDETREAENTFRVQNHMFKRIYNE